MNPQDLQKYGMQIIKVDVPPSRLQRDNGPIEEVPGATRYFLYERGGFGNVAGMRELTGVTPQQLSGLNVREIPYNDFEQSKMAQMGFAGSNTGKANIDFNGLSTLVNQYKVNETEANRTEGQNVTQQPTGGATTQWQLNMVNQIKDAIARGEQVDQRVVDAVNSGGDVMAALSQAYPSAAPVLTEMQTRIETLGAPSETIVSGYQAVNKSGNIPFKQGLSDTQKASISNLVTNKPVATWNDADKQNWSFATNNAPLPTGQATGQVVQGDGGRVYAKNADGTYTYIPDQRTLEDYVIRQGYSDIRSQGVQQIPVTTTETSTAPATPSGSTTTSTQPNNIQAAYDVIDKSNLPDQIKSLFKETVALYPDSTINTDAILQTFNRIKSETIDPYYYNLVKAVETDFRTGIQNLQTAREQELETERTLAGQNIRQARENLEKSGMTFTGKAIEQLGASSAYAQPGQTPSNAIPEQTPFGGLFYEGTVNQANRLMATSSAARQQQALQRLGRQAETQLGSSAIPKLGISFNPVGGQIGEIPEAQQKSYASTLSQLYGNQQRKEDLNTNINPFL